MDLSPPTLRPRWWWLYIWKLILKIWIQNKYTFISIPKYDVSLNFDMKCYFLNFWFVNIWWVSNAMLFVLVNWHEHFMYKYIYLYQPMIDIKTQKWDCGNPFTTSTDEIMCHKFAGKRNKNTSKLSKSRCIGRLQ